MNVMDFVKDIPWGTVVASAFLLYIVMGVAQQYAVLKRHLALIAIGISAIIAIALTVPESSVSGVQTAIDAAVIFFLGYGSSFISDAVGTKVIQTRRVEVPQDVAGGMMTTAGVFDDSPRWWKRWEW